MQSLFYHSYYLSLIIHQLIDITLLPHILIGLCVSFTAKQEIIVGGLVTLRGVSEGIMSMSHLRYAPKSHNVSCIELPPRMMYIFWQQ